MPENRQEEPEYVAFQGTTFGWLEIPADTDDQLESATGLIDMQDYLNQVTPYERLRRRFQQQAQIDLDTDDPWAPLSARNSQPEPVVVEQPDDPEPEPWRPRRGDLIRFTEFEPATVFRPGELGVVEDHYNSNGCGNRNCTSCPGSDISVIVLRPTQWEAETTYTYQYYYVRENQIEPVESDTTGDMVRCRNNRHSGQHNRTSGCISPIRSDSHLDVLLRREGVAAFDQVFAPELAARERRRAEALARVGSLRVGQRYVIEGRGSYMGNIAEIVVSPREGDTEVLCTISYPDGEYRRTMHPLSVFHLGGRWHTSFMGNQVPHFIRFGATTAYSGSGVTVVDREIGDSDDDHECEDHCFDYGCTARDDYDDYDSDDDEPEYHVGDVPIHSYSYRPELTFSGDGPVYMGTELELSTGHGDDGERSQIAAAKILTQSEIGHLVYLKSDGSISGYGFEACFMPMTYDWLVENWPEDLLRSMRNAGATPHSSCGMHVHVSRKAFSDPVHAFKWIKFLYRNQDDFSQMARRDPSSWGSFGRPNERAAAKWHAKGGYGAESRYTAINCVPRETYEVRIFASTLNRTRFLGSLGLVDASVEYTRQATTKQILQEGAWDFGPFRDYVSSFNKYKPLHRELSRILDK